MPSLVAKRILVIEIMIFVFHVTLQDHRIKVLYDFMIKSRSRYITILASLVTIDIVAVEI